VILARLIMEVYAVTVVVLVALFLLFVLLLVFIPEPDESENEDLLFEIYLTELEVEELYRQARASMMWVRPEVSRPPETLR